MKLIPKFYGNETLQNISKIPTHELLSKLGFVNHPKAGLVNWLPLGLTVQRKVLNLVRTKMNKYNFEEVSLSSLTDDALWKVTGRYEKSEELFKLAGETLLLAPTAEEEITSLVKKNVNSYKNFPIRYYQINSKFRNEKRPRGGLLRGKEFLMKDAYSFDVNEETAWVSYEKATLAYGEIFEELEVPFVRAEADSGDIGGSKSHEYHYLDDSGEDVVFVCDGCGAGSNIEVALHSQSHAGVSTVSTAYYTNNEKTIKAHYPTGRTLQPTFLKSVIEGPLHKVTAPVGPIIDVYDTRLPNSGGSTSLPIVLTENGDSCSECDGSLHSSKAIEVGHTFFLGDKYSKPLDLTIPGTPNNAIMGCYGIGISRIIASVAEINRDIHGLIWPRCIAPWDVTIVETTKTDFSEVYQALEDVDYKLDNREKIGLGKKITQSNMVGIPLVLILGRSYPLVEVEVRAKIGEIWKSSQKDADFEWNVEGDKHFVHKDLIAKVIEILLRAEETIPKVDV